MQEELSNKFYIINQQNTVTLEDTDDVSKMTSEMKQAVMAYLKLTDDNI
jgi:hypothetical protein